MTAELSRFRTDDDRARHLAVLRDLIDRRWPVGRTETDVPTGFGRTRVFRSGPAGSTAAPFVLLAGSGGGSLMWTPHVAGLARERPVLALDLIGEPNLSTQTAPISTPADLSRWLTETLDGLGVRRAHLVGCSYGGWVALLHHFDDPGRAASITLLDAGGFGRVTRRFMAWIIVTGLLMFAPAPLRHRAARWFHNSTLLDDAIPRLAKGTFTFRPRLPKVTPLSDEELGRIQAPVLAIFGERSQLYDAGATAARVRDRVPDVRTVVVPGAGHDLVLHSPDLVVEQTVAFARAVEESERNAGGTGDVPERGR
ncbi:alpha/beta fold hydrolase [Symbioplanes lichenis]|uniref:alpha/beta fold hydrolase n=1 Tax=Symbioplanes lichenis TaxID=1629072 RepID=UPI0027396D70|nr:alpha/beta fold hydrolase [Actinoplanes lichenis]